MKPEFLLANFIQDRLTPNPGRDENTFLILLGSRSFSACEMEFSRRSTFLLTTPKNACRVDGDEIQSCFKKHRNTPLQLFALLVLKCCWPVGTYIPPSDLSC